MQVRNITVGVVATLSFVFLIKLMMDAQASPDVEVDDVALGQALAEFRKGESNKTAPKTSLAPIRSPNKIRSKSPEKTETKEETRPKSNTSPLLRTPSYLPKTGLNQAGLSKAIGGDFRSKMNGANKLYDQADYEGAREAALELLEEEPENIRMLRIIVSSSCIMGDEDQAVKHFKNLPNRDQKQMRGRCKRYGIDFDE